MRKKFAFRKRRVHKEYRERKGFLSLEITFFLSFFAGIILANLYGKSRTGQYGALNSYFVQQLKHTSFRGNGYLLYVAGVRLPVILGLFLLGMTAAYAVVHYIYVSYAGVSLGFLFVTAVMSLGIRRLPFLLLSLFPHGLFYVLVYVGMVRLQWNYHRNYRKRSVREWVETCAMLTLLFTIGILLESYVAPDLCRKVL